MTSASQWKRCFTNPDSWMKWNIFSALFLGLELPIPTSRDTPHHICLSRRESKKNKDFPAKMLRLSGRATLSRVRPLCFPSTWQSQDISKDSSSRTLSLSHWNSPWLWFFWRESNKSFLQSQAGSLRHQERPHWKSKVVPLCSGTSRFGEFSLVARKFHSKLLPNAKKKKN